MYKGIAEDYGDFTDIVGDAAPVLANVEKAIERLALTGEATAADVDSEVNRIRRQAKDVHDAPVGNDDLGEPVDAELVREPPSLVGAVTPGDLERVLTTNGLTRRCFEPDETRPGIFWLKPPAEALSAVSFGEDGGVISVEEYYQPSPVAPCPSRSTAPSGTRATTPRWSSSPTAPRASSPAARRRSRRKLTHAGRSPRASCVAALGAGSRRGQQHTTMRPRRPAPRDRPRSV